MSDLSPVLVILAVAITPFLAVLVIFGFIAGFDLRRLRGKRERRRIKDNERFPLSR